jgi:integrase
MPWRQFGKLSRPSQPEPWTGCSLSSKPFARLTPSKDFLDPSEIDRRLKATKRGRHGARDCALLLMVCRHALPVSEAVDMRLDRIKLKETKVRTSVVTSIERD